MRQTNRITPVGPAGAYKTYQVVAPLSTHFRPASCVEAGCDAHQNGWRTAVDESTDLGQGQAHYIRREAGRAYVEAREGGLTVFTFEPGQQCFRPHQVRGDRPEIYVVKDGDWRMSQNVRRHANAGDWVDDFKTHQDRLATRMERG